jgi:hypothetical protein
MTANGGRRRGGDPAVSLIVVVHNAFLYTLRMLRTLPRTRGVDYELVVVDNRSRLPTRLLLIAAALFGRIQRLCLLERNTMFAPGNNIGLGLTSRSARHVLLLNSDVEVRDPDWLARLLAHHQGGATSFGYVETEPCGRADGYCLLVDRELMIEHGLDEEFEWFWSVTKLQANLLTQGHQVRAIKEHDHLLFHFGGKSGRRKLTRTAKGMNLDREEVRGWFGGCSVEVIERA